MKNHKCGREGIKMYEESDTFLLGPDARIHFTDTHLTIRDGGLDQVLNSALLCKVHLLNRWSQQFMQPLDQLFAKSYINHVFSKLHKS